jgi:hypothetical protein
MGWGGRLPGRHSAVGGQCGRSGDEVPCSRFLEEGASGDNVFGGLQGARHVRPCGSEARGQWRAEYSSVKACSMRRRIASLPALATLLSRSPSAFAGTTIHPRSPPSLLPTFIGLIVLLLPFHSPSLPPHLLAPKCPSSQPLPPHRHVHHGDLRASLRVVNFAGVGLDDHNSFSGRRFVRTTASWDHPICVQCAIAFSVGRFHWQSWCHWQGANGPMFRNRGFLALALPRHRTPKVKFPCRAHVDVVKGAEVTWHSNNSPTVITRWCRLASRCTSVGFVTIHAAIGFSINRSIFHNESIMMTLHAKRPTTADSMMDLI